MRLKHPVPDLLVRLYRDYDASVSITPSSMEDLSIHLHFNYKYWIVIVLREHSDLPAVGPCVSIELHSMDDVIVVYTSDIMPPMEDILDTVDTLARLIDLIKKVPDFLVFLRR